MAAQNVLTASGLVRRFGELTAVDGVSFSIAAGETYGLLGPNGAGKTTTISMICGLLQADAGTVQVLGRDISPASTSAKAVLGLVPQEIALYPDLTGAQNLRFFGSLQGMSGKELATRIDEVLEVVRLTERAEDKVEEYSGGMQRRANIAVGLLHRPELLILDEPTVGVDPQSRNAILESVTDLGSQGLAVLYTTHYMEEAQRLCDRVGIIDEGKLIAEGRPTDLIKELAAATLITLEVDGDGAADLDSAVQEWAARCKALPGVSQVRLTDNRLEIDASGGSRVIPAAVAAADQQRLAVTGVDVTEPDLETVFLRLTGKALRD